MAPHSTSMLEMEEAGSAKRNKSSANIQRLKLLLMITVISAFAQCMVYVVLHSKKTMGYVQDRGPAVRSECFDSSQLSKAFNCYIIQIYHKDNSKVADTGLARSVVERAQKGPLVDCGDNVRIELTLGDERHEFAGADAVVFHYVRNAFPVPPPRDVTNPGQAWVFFSAEPPFTIAKEGHGLSALPIHGTWTYHRVSEVWTPHGTYKNGAPTTNHRISAAERLAGKSKLLVWIGNHCNQTSWPRSDFVNKLRKIVPVDVYGDCGGQPLPVCPGGIGTDESCVASTLKRYKFYLSLEAVECEDYTTETLWGKPLRHGVVPVVNGPSRRVYEELAPPNSFIYVGDYPTMKELVAYLYLLDSKPELYAAYFEWQYDGSIETAPTFVPQAFCSLVPIIDKVRRGQVKQTPLGKTLFWESCRAEELSAVERNILDTDDPGFGVGAWNPW